MITITVTTTITLSADDRERMLEKRLRKMESSLKESRVETETERGEKERFTTRVDVLESQLEMANTRADGLNQELESERGLNKEASSKARGLTQKALFRI